MQTCRGQGVRLKEYRHDTVQYINRHKDTRNGPIVHVKPLETGLFTGPRSRPSLTRAHAFMYVTLYYCTHVFGDKVVGINVR